MKQIFITSLLFSLLSLQSLAQSFGVEVSTDSILIGNVFQVRYTLENIDGAFNPPEFEYMEVISGPEVSSSFQFINGESSNYKSYIYLLRPTEEGELILNPAYIDVDGEITESDLVTIQVYPNPDNIKQDNIFERSNDSFFSFPSFRSPFGDSPFERSPFGNQPQEAEKKERKKVSKYKKKRI